MSPHPPSPVADPHPDPPPFWGGSNLQIEPSLVLVRPISGPRFTAVLRSAMNGTWYLFSFEGRIPRARWWAALSIILGWLLFLGGITILADLIVPGGPSAKFNISIGYLTGHIKFDAADPSAKINISVHELFALIDRAARNSLSRSDVIALPANLLGMATGMWMFLATSIKRLHDRSRSGWWIVPFFVLPSLFDDLADWLPTQYLPDWLAIPIVVALNVLLIWGVVESGFLRGTRGPNRFGQTRSLSQPPSVRCMVED